jgi:hypothetical protein
MSCSRDDGLDERMGEKEMGERGMECTSEK